MIRLPSHNVTLLHEAIDQDQVIILTAELLIDLIEAKVEKVEALKYKIIQTAMENSNLVTAYGKSNFSRKDWRGNIT